MAEQDEVVAGLKIVGCVARADGITSESERRQLRFMLDELAPAGVTLDDVLADGVDLETEIARVKDPALRTAIHTAAAFLSRVDGETHEREQAIVERVADAFDIGLGDRAGSAFGATVRGQMVANATELDAAVRDPKVAAKIRRAAVVCGILGANPFPIVSLATEVGIFWLQARLVEEVAGLHGHVMQRKESLGLLGATFGLGAARAALLQLVKFVPGWGSAAGALAGFTTTFALGKTIDRHFTSGGQPSNIGDDARSIFHDIRTTEARTAYTQSKADLEDPETRARVDAILGETREGKLSGDQAAHRLGALD